ncbi:fimbrial protein [Serratia marcescens]|uniref:fimbrial protein n=1 Tax=Serratia marcescens TaxID=615 RepID=UPI00118112A8|nr:fimbrial protein [Serratia marcescens]TSB25747.1 fimbrial protein [Serratia marcescens]TXE43920.1 fimbrial protein [Serratia marcescens]
MWLIVFVGGVFCAFSGGVSADCIGTLSIPLHMNGQQTDLTWRGDIGGSGSGDVISTCQSPTEFPNDFRFTSLSDTAVCTNATDGKDYTVPVLADGSQIHPEGAMDKMGDETINGEIIQGWGILRQTTRLPLSGIFNNAYFDTQGSMDVSSLPAGSYQCKVKTAHFFVGSNSTNLQSAYSAGLATVVSGNRWGVGTASIQINSACAHDGPSRETIDFGTVTSNGETQAGPPTTVTLVCNYDVSSNNITYMLNSNNPVSGEPSTGHSIVVGLTNGANVTLNGGNVTPLTARKMSVDIESAIDTRNALAGVGNGSATLTFDYQ